MATVVEIGCTIGGRIETDGHIEIMGRVEGSVHAMSVRIHADAVVIAEVVATDRIDVAAGARVIGDLRAPRVELEAGARVDGRVDLVDPLTPPPVAPDAEPTIEFSREVATIQLIKRPPRRPTRPPPPAAPAPRALPSLPRPANRSKLVTRRPKPKNPR